MSIPKPVFDQARGYREWLISAIYNGKDGSGAFVPNVDDKVWDWDNGLYRVTQVDLSTGIAQLTLYVPPIKNTELGPDQVLYGTSPSRPSELYRLYVNERTDIPTAAVDSRLTVNGCENQFIRLFRGTDTSESTGEIISMRLNQTGRVIDDKIPLELVATKGMVGTDNIAIKTPSIGNVVSGLPDGEVVTAVVYTASGVKTSINPLLVQRTEYVRNINSPTRYISDISLESPFLNKSNPYQIDAPLNLPVDSLNLSLRVHYSDGSTVVPIDGSRAAVHGLEGYTVSQAGQVCPLMLTYQMAEGESSRVITDENGNCIVRQYEITTQPAKGVYNVKLFVVPKWNHLYNQWRLEYWLYNLDRSIAKDVTSFVAIGSVESQVFDPLNFGNVQRMTVALDMSAVDTGYLPFRHVQTFEITLNSPNGGEFPLWNIRYNPGSGDVYGADGFAVCSTADSGIVANLTMGGHYATDWLDMYFGKLYPLYSPRDETSAPVPTHVEVGFGDSSTTIEIKDFKTPVALKAIPREGDSLTLKWICKTESTDLLLGIGAITVKYSN